MNPPDGQTRLNCSPVRGFRLSLRRFTVRRLRSKLVRLFGVLRRLYEGYLKSIGRTLRRGRRGKVPSIGYYCAGGGGGGSRRMRSLAHSNSFCSEAIADCLDFIKRNSVNHHDREKEPMLRSAISPLVQRNDTSYSSI